MSDDIARLLSRNLHDVFGEGDAARRKQTIDEIFTEDAVFYEPGGIHRGRQEIDRIAGTIRASHPEFRYTTVNPPEQLHETAGRVQWVSGLPGEPAYAGTDFAVFRDGRIASIHLFFDKLPGSDT
jgi:hypothetical protein